MAMEMVPEKVAVNVLCGGDHGNEDDSKRNCRPRPLWRQPWQWRWYQRNWPPTSSVEATMAMEMISRNKVANALCVGNPTNMAAASVEATMAKKMISLIIAANTCGGNHGNENDLAEHCRQLVEATMVMKIISPSIAAHVCGGNYGNEDNRPEHLRPRLWRQPWPEDDLPEHRRPRLWRKPWQWR